MRRHSLTALLAVPLLLFAADRTAHANPNDSIGFGCAGYCFKMFPHIHQHGPLYNYGPYYGYYPFKPYGPWDAYLRYDPFFYGDPNANGGQRDAAGAGAFGRNPNLPYFRGLFGGHGNGFSHASWLHGGWFRGHTWLHGGFGHKSGGCSSCGGIAVETPVVSPGDPISRYSGFGSPDQSAAFYVATPTLDPVIAVMPAAGTVK